jgi:alpha-L-rhamnosidase
MLKYFIALALFMSQYLLITANSAISPVNLQCENLSNPLGIDISTPVFSWKISSVAKNQKQSAYELIVSDNLNDIGRNAGNMWTSGKVLTSNTIFIQYAGTPLQSTKRYYWRVKVYDANGENSGWSEVANFETAMLKQDEWTAKWISDGSRPPAEDKDAYGEDRMPLFRHNFKTGKKIQSARLYITGLGYYEAYLNGKKISDNVLDPGFTTYRKEVLYVVHDITSNVKKGDNVFGIMLGNGWWNPLPFKLFGKWYLRDYQQTGRPCLKAEIHIRYSDGSLDKIASNREWKTAPGPVVKNSVYLGESYDARYEQQEWNTINTNPEGWKNVVEVEGPSVKLSAQMLPPIKVTKVLKPVKVWKKNTDTFMVDMGRNFAGVARIRVKGKRGTKIVMRYGEGLFKDGSLNVMTTAATQIKEGAISGGPGAPPTAWQEDSYILKGDGDEVWAPKFTFHGFQFVEVVGWPGTLTIDNIEGLRMNSDLPENGTFSCSNNMFNKLHEAVQWTYLSNVFSLQSDCPGREKMGYGGDMVATATSFIYNYDMLQFYHKTLSDFVNEQRPLGGFPSVVPFTGIYDYGYGDLAGPLGWQLAFGFIQKQLYEYYGDKRIIANSYPAFKRQLDYLISIAPPNLYTWDISDHEALDPKPEGFSAAAFYYHHILLGAEFAGILNKRDDSTHFAETARNIKDIILAKYHVPSTGRFDNATQSAQLFALWYGLAPDEAKSMDVLIKEFERHNWHLSTGIFSTKMLFDVFRNNNMNDAAYRIANQRDFPGWGYMLDNGATTIWETWAFPETDPSRNHPMFGSVDEWFYRSLAGINPLSPGFSSIQIKPQPAGDLKWVKASYNSIKGKILSEWTIDADRFQLHVAIPANTEATIYVPSAAGQTVMENGKPVKVGAYESGYAVIVVGSGEYNFSSTMLVPVSSFRAH